MLSKDQMLGKYQILDRLGAGGFGTVYLAKDTLLNRRVALKVPHHQGDEQGLLQEPRIMAALKHPNIVELITVERQGETFFMVMEYIDGESLDRLVRRERTLPPGRALDIAIDVCSAIQFAHSQQVLHRDLRPANILITKEGVAKVTDFGTSRILEMQRDGFARTRIGSPPYMAPEHFRGRAVFQSDLWSVGISIYEMLTGTVPFYDADPVKIAQALQNTPIVPPHCKNPAVPRTLSEVVMRALSVNLGDRYLSAQEFLKALLGVREQMGRETRPLGGLPSPSRTPVAPRPAVMVKTQPRFCWNCYKPLPRLAQVCPGCGEKN
ncbi:serine/threonine protein kinase [Holophaga foetida]|uniref:serine/threonine protein kinase n=1 Tax=Holophaga foetida TaxID=35839 RepID=UPI0002472AC8|nr:serine/threonine-protein kinase [Holophaga foetida]